MSKGNVFENQLLLLLFNNDAIPNIGDVSGIQPSGVAGNFHVSLHTADPTELGDQTTSEATYTSYARVAVARTTGGWTVVEQSDGTHYAENFGAISFPQATGGSNTITYFAVGTKSTGTGEVIYSGALTASLAVSSGITPSFAAGALTVTED